MEQTAAKREGDTNNRPETIYLVPGECDGVICDVWCEDPAPGTDMDPAEATRYVRADLLEQEVRFHRGAVEGWADEATALVDSREECKRLKEKNQALEQCLEDVKRLPRELDIALNAAGAAEQERDQLIAYQAELVRELTSCQSVLHMLAHSGEVTPAYADDAKAVLNRKPEYSLAAREAEVIRVATAKTRTFLHEGGRAWLCRVEDLEKYAAQLLAQANLCDSMAQVREEGAGPIFLQQPAVPGFIHGMARLITAQDNRMTADPLFCVFQKREIVTDEDYGYDRMVWCSNDGEADEETAQHLEELREDVDSDHWHENEIELDGAEWRRLAVKEIDEFVTACFTEQGCKDFLAVNGHNLRKPFIYVTSLFRNEEMKTLRNWIMSQDAGNHRQVGEEVSA